VTSHAAHRRWASLDGDGAAGASAARQVGHAKAELQAVMER